MDLRSLSGSRRRLQRWLAVLTVVGAIVIAWGCFWWLSQKRAEIRYLPRYNVGEWILYPVPPQPRAQWSTMRRADFSRSFVLSEDPGPALLQLRAFTDCQVYVNGATVELPQHTDADWKKSREREIGSYLRLGKNEIRVTVTNADGPPALWLTVSLRDRILATDREWDVSLDGAVLRAAMPSSQPLELRQGNPVYGGEGTVEALRGRWRTLALFAVLATLLVPGCYLLLRRFKPAQSWFKTGAAVRLGVVVCALLWCLLLWNNLQTLLFPIGFDADQHMLYVRYIVQHKALPLADEGWESHQPPLYYLVSAGALGLLGLSTDDTATVAVLRVFAFLAMMTQIALVAASLRIIFPNKPVAQVTGVVLTAFLPMHFYIAHYVSNDLLAGVLGSGAIYCCLRVLVDWRASLVRLFFLGLLLGAAMLTKLTALVIPPVVLGVLVGQLLVHRRFQPALWLRRVAVPLLVCLGVSGWHFARVWHHFGTPLVGSYDAASGFRWWQTPCYSTALFYARFGRSIGEPFFSGYNGLADGLYSTLWGDGLWGGVGELASRTPWNYDLMTAGYALALLPTLGFAIGILLALVQLFRRPQAEWFLLGGIAFAMVAAQVYHFLRLPYACHIKAFYALPALVPFCAYAAWGFDFIAKRGKLLGLGLGVLLATWALTSYASFWVLNTSSTTEAWVGLMLAAKKHYAAAIDRFNAALRSDETNDIARVNLGQLLLALGRPRDAQEQFERGLAYYPESPQEHQGLATALAAQGQIAQAIEHVKRALDDAPDFRDQGLLGRLLLQDKRPRLAVEAFRRSLGNMLGDPLLHQGLGDALMVLDDWREAIEQYRLASNLQPQSVDMLNRLARTLATCVHASARDGPEAVRLAGQAAALTRYQDAIVLDTLAAAYAEAGQYREAQQTQVRAIQLVGADGNPEFAKAMQQREQLYRSGKPYREALKLQ
jgi:tetratricopeptide (TPR) repeat protein